MSRQEIFDYAQAEAKRTLEKGRRLEDGWITLTLKEMADWAAALPYWLKPDEDLFICGLRVIRHG